MATVTILVHLVGDKEAAARGSESILAGRVKATF